MCWKSLRLSRPRLLSRRTLTTRAHKLHSHQRTQHSYNTAPAPDATAGTSDADAYASAGTPAPAAPPAKVAANTDSYPPDPNLGSINDYENQPGEDGQLPSFALGGGARRPEPPQGSMTANLIIGGILVGMMALEIASSHHHR